MWRYAVRRRLSSDPAPTFGQWGGGGRPVRPCLDPPMLSQTKCQNYCSKRNSRAAQLQQMFDMSSYKVAIGPKQLILMSPESTSPQSCAHDGRRLVYIKGRLHTIPLIFKLVPNSQLNQRVTIHCLFHSYICNKYYFLHDVRQLNRRENRFEKIQSRSFKVIYFGVTGKATRD